MTTTTFGLVTVTQPTVTLGRPHTDALDGMRVERIPSSVAAELVITNHYLHRRPPISHAFGLFHDDTIIGVITLGVPASRHLQISACRTDPSLVIELNRLWLTENLPRNTASWFVSRALQELPPRIIVSYADTTRGHDGTVYRAMSWKWAGWTDMGRKTPRPDYLPNSGGHSRDATRHGWYRKVPRGPKHRYWTVSGTPAERRALLAKCTWPSLIWAEVENKPKLGTRSATVEGYAQAA